MLRAQRLLEDPTVVDVARSAGCTPSQVLLAFQLRRGIVVIPKVRAGNAQGRRGWGPYEGVRGPQSVSPARLTENLGALRVALTDAQVGALRGLDCGFRLARMPQDAGAAEYPFGLDEAAAATPGV